MAKVTVHGGPSDEHAETSEDVPAGADSTPAEEQPSEKPRPARTRTAKKTRE
ncbi:hypothetical protein [Streptomyces spinosus]|uniref:hypothetical protein n=1 Tax=Streptomyces spinosus TaxID=2872623 RepID=UPI001CECDE36|nr:hypothetical protein [Streptomyces spinosus]